MKSQLTSLLTIRKFSAIACGTMAVCSVVFLPYSVSADAIPVVLLEDDFNDNSIDPTKWNVVPATGANVPAGSNVTETSQRAEFFNRGHLNTVQQFDPNAADVGGLTISGQWTYVSGDDFMQVLTRSDGTPSGNFGETANGVEFQASAAGADKIDIVGKGGATVNNSTGGDNLMPGGIGATDVFDFVVMDDGFNLSLTLTRTSNPLDTVTITADSNFAPAANLITFHNREGNRTSALDNVLVESKTLSIPEPSTCALAFLALAGLTFMRRRTPRHRS